MNNNYGVIYMLFNKINSKIYIGQTVDFEKRMANHKTIRNNKIKDKIHNAIRKYNWNNFDKLILDAASNKEELDVLECFYIEKFQSIEFGYNIKEAASKGRLPQSVKDNISKSLIGRRLSEETKQKMKQLKSKETKQKMSKAKQGIKHPMFGKHQSEESKQKNKIQKYDKMIRIQCIETGEVFESQKQCAVKMNLDQGSISNHLKNKSKYVKGFTFKILI